MRSEAVLTDIDAGTSTTQAREGNWDIWRRFQQVRPVLVVDPSTVAYVSITVDPISRLETTAPIVLFPDMTIVGQGVQLGEPMAAILGEEEHPIVRAEAPILRRYEVNLIGPMKAEYRAGYKFREGA